MPNILISGKSIGGGDDIAALDTSKTLVEKVKATSAQNISVKERFVEGPKGT